MAMTTFAGADGMSHFTIDTGDGVAYFTCTDSTGGSVAVPLAPDAVERVRDWLRANTTTTPKERLEVATDPRWDTIVAGADLDPSNSFLNDIVAKGRQYGSLTDKQLAAAFTTAQKNLKNGPPPPKPGFEPF